jgi:hypothetical protein
VLWYRVKASVDPLVIQRVRDNSAPELSQKLLANELKTEMEIIGFPDVRLVTQDPTEPLVWNFIAGSDGQKCLRTSSKLVILSFEEVEEPPVIKPHPESPSVLDSGIPYDEAHALAYALARDPDPRHLLAFAESFIPDFPIAVGLLLAKGRIVSATKVAKAKVRVPVGELRRLTKGLGEEVQRMWGASGAIDTRATFSRKLPVDIQQIVKDTSALGQERLDKELRPLLATMLITPVFIQSTSDQLSQRFKVSPATARAALASTRMLGASGFGIIEPDILRRILPGAPIPISATAINLVQASKSPFKAGVTNTSMVTSRINDLNQRAQEGDPQALLAKEHIARATKLLDRRKWIENYRRQEQTHLR